MSILWDLILFLKEYNQTSYLYVGGKFFYHSSVKLTYFNLSHVLKKNLRFYQENHRWVLKQTTTLTRFWRRRSPPPCPKAPPPGSVERALLSLTRTTKTSTSSSSELTEVYTLSRHLHVPDTWLTKYLSLLRLC